MKKFFSLMLALCLALAAIPAFAESAVSGTWYLQFLGMDAGTFELNEDGTSVVSMMIDGEEKKVEGTWTEEGEKVTLTVQDQPLPMTFDGKDLLLDLEAIGALGLDSSMGMSGVDPSALTSLIAMSREPSKISLADFSAYQKDGTLPEGVTDAEMQAVMAQLMVTVFSLMGTASGSGETEEVLPVTIVEDNFFIRDGYGSKEAVYIAKIKNENEANIYLSDAVLTVKGADGAELGKAEYLDTVGSRYLEPGEETYISMNAYLADGADPEGADHEVVLTTASATYQTPDAALEVASAEMQVEEGYWVQYTASVTISNSSEENLKNFDVLVVVRDADGKLLDLVSSALYSAELPAGSSIILKGNMDSRTVEYCTANSIEISTDVEALATVSGY